MRRTLLAILIWPLMGAANLTTPGAASPQIVISDMTDGKPATYKTTIWVVADSDIDSVTFVPSELKGKDKGQKIPPSAVHVNSDAPVTFKNGTPKPIAVSIDAAQVADEFHGELTLSASTALADASKRIPVVFRLTAKPNAAAIPAAFSFKTVRCVTQITCAVSRWVLPKGQALATLPWQLSNYSAGTVDWTPNVAVLRGEKSGDFIELGVSLAPRKGSEEAVALTPSFTLPAQQPTKLLFTVDRSTTGADHYQGQYRIELKGSEPLVVPFSLDVRSGPLLPLLVLILGIVLGRLIQSTNTPRAQAQLRLMDQYQRIAIIVDSVVEVTARNYLHLRLGQIFIDIGKMSRPEADLAGQLDAILRLATDSNKLDKVELLIQNIADPATKAQLLGLLASARSAIIAEDAASAERDLTA